MTESSSLDRVLIPGIPTLRQSGVPSVAVALPMIAAMRPELVRLKLTFLLVMLGMFALLLLALFNLPPSSQGISSSLFQFAMGVYASFWIVWFGAEAASDVRDLYTEDAALEINAAGLADSRTGVNLLWNDVASARYLLTRSGVAGVTLSLRGDLTVPPSANIGWFHQTKPNEVHVKTMLMTKPAEQLAQVIVTLVSMAGGNILPHKGAIFGTQPPTILKQPAS